MFRPFIAHPAVNAVINAVVAAFLSVFVIINFDAWRASGDVSYLLVAGNESLYVLLYLIRRAPRAFSTSALDWGVGFAGSFIGTLLRPAYRFASIPGLALVVIGTIANAFAVLSLNRSIGTVAALRHMKTRGMYRYLRHPMYASEICVLIGYLFGNLSAWNLSVSLINVMLLAVRINREEHFLMQESDYATYAKAVRWRLIPFIY